MFVFLSKKIAIPNKRLLYCVDWNIDDGWIACGGESGLLKVIKLEGQGSTLSVNQTLEGHEGSVLCCVWNSEQRRLTTSDEKGLIIVWMLHKGMWYEEMINNRGRSYVVDMKWTADGDRICIVYRDGMIIVGSVDGSRLWGKELRVQLSTLMWSPDGRHILFGSRDGGDVVVYDSTSGVHVDDMPVGVKMGRHQDDGDETLVGMEWFPFNVTRTSPTEGTPPTLAVCFASGKCQLSHGFGSGEEDPIVIDTGMTNTCIRWMDDGSSIAIGGYEVSSSTGKSVNLVQFYSPFGDHLRTIHVPGRQLKGLSFDANSSRVVMAVDHFLYFATLRHDYNWAYFGNTLVFSYTRPGHTEHSIVFWNSRTEVRNAKVIKNLLAIRACDDRCVLVARSTSSVASGSSERRSTSWILVLCNSIGNPIASRLVTIKPLFTFMTREEVIICSSKELLIWSYRKEGQDTDVETAPAEAQRDDDMRSKVAKMVGSLRSSSASSHAAPEATELIVPLEGSADANDNVCAITAGNHHLLLARESGAVQVFSLPKCTRVCHLVLKCRPERLTLNCDCSRLAVVDINGDLTMYDYSRIAGIGEAASSRSVHQLEPLNFERRDVWDLKWSDDSPELLACMEKSRMYVYRGLDPEEPVLSNGYVCKFKNLKIKTLLLDEVMKDPDGCKIGDHFFSYETKSLRDTSDLLKAGNVSIDDACDFVAAHPHPRLWDLVAETCLRKQDFNSAENAFVKNGDYLGISNCNRLKKLGDKQLQKAEVAASFKKFEEAEKIYSKMDRLDLAIDMHSKYGDWFRVIELARSGASVDDAVITRAYDQIGYYFAGRQNWEKCTEFFVKSKNNDMLARAYYHLEDFDSLTELMKYLPEGNPILNEMGESFASVGLSDVAVDAFVKGGDMDRAVEACIELNQWDRAISFAHATKNVEKMLEKLGTKLVESNRVGQSIELYRKAGKFTEAAQLLMKVAKECAASRVLPLRTKKIFVLAAIEVDKYKRSAFDGKGDKGSSHVTTAQTLESLLEVESRTGRDKNLENPWRGAEAFHFLMLAQRQLYEGDVLAALRTSMLLTNYEDLLDPMDTYSLIALCAYHAQYFKTCSKAFIRLESLDDGEKYSDLAVQVFTTHRPADPPAATTSCPHCKSALPYWATECPTRECGARFPPCVVTGGVLQQESSYWTCKVCKHHATTSTIYNREFCPLCHSNVQS